MKMTKKIFLVVFILLNFTKFIVGFYLVDVSD